MWYLVLVKAVIVGLATTVRGELILGDARNVEYYQRGRVVDVPTAVLFAMVLRSITQAVGAHAFSHRVLETNLMQYVRRERFSSGLFTILMGRLGAALESIVLSRLFVLQRRNIIYRRFETLDEIKMLDVVELSVLPPSESTNPYDEKQASPGLATPSLNAKFSGDLGRLPVGSRLW